MKTLITLLSVFFLSCSSILTAASNTFLDYQNYNHGYCPDCNCSPCKCSGGGCQAPAPDTAKNPKDPVNPPSDCPKPNPCSPPATTACTQCGLNVIYVGIGMVVLAAAAVIIVGSDNGSVHGHSAP